MKKCAWFLLGAVFFEGNVYTIGEATLSNHFGLPSEKDSTLKRKNLLLLREFF